MQTLGALSPGALVHHKGQENGQRVERGQTMQADIRQIGTFGLSFSRGLDQTRFSLWRKEDGAASDVERPIRYEHVAGGYESGRLVLTDVNIEVPGSFARKSEFVPLSALWWNKIGLSGVFSSNSRGVGEPCYQYHQVMAPWKLPASSENARKSEFVPLSALWWNKIGLSGVFRTFLATGALLLCVCCVSALPSRLHPAALCTCKPD